MFKDVVKKVIDEVAANQENPEFVSILKFKKDLISEFKKEIKTTNLKLKTNIAIHSSGLSGYVIFNNSSTNSGLDHILISWDICNPNFVILKYKQQINTVELIDIAREIRNIYFSTQF